MEKKKIHGSQREGLGGGQNTPTLEHSLSKPGLGYLKRVWLQVDDRGDPWGGGTVLSLDHSRACWNRHFVVPPHRSKHTREQTHESWGNLKAIWGRISINFLVVLTVTIVLQDFTNGGD